MPTRIDRREQEDARDAQARAARRRDLRPARSARDAASAVGGGRLRAARGGASTPVSSSRARARRLARSARQDSSAAASASIDAKRSSGRFAIALRDDGVDALRDLGPPGADARDRVADVAHRHRHQRVARVRDPAGEQLVRDDAERVLVGALVAALAVRLLGRDVLARARAPCRWR